MMKGAAARRTAAIFLSFLLTVSLFGCERPVSDLIDCLDTSDARKIETTTDALVKRGDKALEPLQAALSNPSANIRANACAALVCLRGSAAAGDISPLLADSVESVRLKACGYLQGMSDDAAIQSVKGSAAALAAVRKALKSPTADVRICACNLLLSAVGAEGAEEASALLSDASPGVRVGAAKALAKTMGSKAADGIAGLFADEEDAVKLAAYDLLEQMGDGVIRAELAGDKALTALLAGLNRSSSQDVEKRAGDLLAKAGPGAIDGVFLHIGDFPFTPGTCRAAQRVLSLDLGKSVSAVANVIAAEPDEVAAKNAISLFRGMGTPGIGALNDKYAASGSSGRKAALNLYRKLYQTDADASFRLSLVDGAYELYGKVADAGGKLEAATLLRDFAAYSKSNYDEGVYSRIARGLLGIYRSKTSAKFKTSFTGMLGKTDSVTYQNLVVAYDAKSVAKPDDYDVNFLLLGLNKTKRAGEGLTALCEKVTPTKTLIGGSAYTKRGSGTGKRTKVVVLYKYLNEGWKLSPLSFTMMAAAKRVSITKMDADTAIYVYEKKVYSGVYNTGTKGYVLNIIVALVDLKAKVVVDQSTIKGEPLPWMFTYYGAAPSEYVTDSHREKIDATVGALVRKYKLNK